MTLKEAQLKAKIQELEMMLTRELEKGLNAKKKHAASMRRIDKKLAVLKFRIEKISTNHIKASRQSSFQEKWNESIDEQISEIFTELEKLNKLPKFIGPFGHLNDN